VTDVLDRLVDRFVAAYSWGLPDWSGNVMDVGIFTPGLKGVVRPVPWDAFVLASAPLLRGDELHFAVTADRRTVTEEHVPDDAAIPLAEALATDLAPPFSGVAVRAGGDEWAAAANQAQVVELDNAKGDEVEVSRVGGEISAQVHGVESKAHYPALEALLDGQEGDVAVVAHRFVGSIWVADVFPL
jgi:hypothetical protein